jgi:DNA polymerase-1
LTHRPLGPGDRLFLVDASNFVFRAYFQSINQDRKYNQRADGLPTGAVRLWATKLFQFIREGALGQRPTHLGVIFDKSEDSFRRELYPAYKGNRSEPPDDLKPQFPLFRAAVRAFGLEPIEQDRYEADDLIATYACEAERRGAEVLVISADKDLMQLVRPRVGMFDPASGDAKKGQGFRPERRIGHDEVVEYFGVPPDKVVDVQALAGDSTDNVPGAPGIGIKTAAQLIAEYGDLETLLARAHEIKQPKRRETLTDPEIVERVRVSKKLVELTCDVPLATPLDDLSLAQPDAKALVSFLKGLEFTTLTKRVAEHYGVEAGEIEPDPAIVALKPPPGLAGLSLPTPPSPDGAEPTDDRSERETNPAGREARRPPASGPAALAGATPARLAAERREKAAAAKVDRARYETVTDLAVLDSWIARAREAGVVAVDTETTGLEAMACNLVGLSLAVGENEAAYVPFAHHGGDGLFGGGRLPGQLDRDAALARLKPLLEHPGVLKVGHNVKFDIVVLGRCGVDLAPIDDTLLIAYVLDAGRAPVGMDELSKLWLGHDTIAFKDVVAGQKGKKDFGLVGLAEATAYAAEDADVTLRLWKALKPRLPAERMTAAYETLERPLVRVLADMEAAGILIDRQILSRLSGDFAQRMAALEHEIYELAGERVQLGSPKQLGDLLFGKMGLPGGTKTPTGQWSTRAGLLEELAEEGHELPRKIVDWRQLSKLRSTYTDALPDYVDQHTGRVHTCFSMAATTTGRLSSSDPNLQNIPIRTEEGRKIRTAFVAAPGTALISADYSQIELRILAHMADIPALRQAFADGVDIHAMTASEMFGVPVEGMPGEVRRRAKAINFGIIYGISAFGLANQLSIPREEAGAYIKRYFERFPGIRAYMDEQKALCREQGFVTTIFGRKCHYPAIQSKNPSERAFVERQAINAPIQGSAADIIRRAMARMPAALKAAKLSAKMLLQVHDELVFEAPESEVEATLPVIREVMERATLPAVSLAVPLAVEARAAANWDEAH